MKRETMNTPAHFPCAARVKMLQLGAEETDIVIKKISPRTDMSLYRALDLSQQTVPRSYIKQISQDLTFADDVVKERSYHTTHYDAKYFLEALSLDGLVSLPKKTKFLMGRHNARGHDVRHVTCGFTKIIKNHQLKPLKRKIMDKANQMHQQAIDAEKKAAEDEIRLIQEEEGIFLTELVSEGQKTSKTSITSKLPTTPLETSSTVPTSTWPSTPVDEIVDKERNIGSRGPVVPRARKEPKMAVWDAYLLSVLSPGTANWVVRERMSPSRQKTNLVGVLNKWYGGAPSSTDLIRDDLSDGEWEKELERKKKKAKQKKKETKELTFFEKVKSQVPKRSVDPYSDNNEAPFYRQPAGVRRKRKTEEKEGAGAINTTARAVVVKSVEPFKPIILRDFVNPDIRDTLFDPDNQYQREWLAGFEQVHTSDKSKIVMVGTQNIFKKNLRKEYPDSSSKWYVGHSSERTQSAMDGRVSRGHIRWTALPQPVDDSVQIADVMPPGYDAEFHRSPDPTTRRNVKQNTSLMQIIDEWRSKWHLSGQFADCDYMDLIQDMADIQPHVRLKAIATVGKAAEYKPPNEAGITLKFKDNPNIETVVQLPDEVYVALNFLLEDEHDQVQKAAAITLFALNKPSPKAESILRTALTGDNSLDRWTSAQCLAHFGECDSDVAGEIITQLLDTEDAVKHERAINLLAKISNNSILVHSLVAEQLNSSSWRHKVIACKILPTLHGTINKDISNKLSELMWNDWHTDVRKAAAQCLGKTQHGRDVHDDIKTRIVSKDERIRLEAISKIGQLGIMTAKLLPPFLECFDDSYMSIRVEACITASNLKIQDKQVLDKLVYLATFDNVWKVKVIAVQAIGNIGVCTDEVLDCLIWALRYEEMEGVRAEACRALVELGCNEEEFLEILQDRLLIETSKLVREEMMAALAEMGVNTLDDMDMVTQIKREVRKLCNRDNISNLILENEMSEQRKANLGRLIYDTKQELDRWMGNPFKDMSTPELIDERKTSLSVEQEMHRHKVLEKIRILSERVGSDIQPSRIKSASSPTSVGPSREGTMFTPTGDKELEALMSREDTSEGASYVSESVAVKSMPETASLSRSGTLQSLRSVSPESRRERSAESTVAGSEVTTTDQSLKDDRYLQVNNLDSQPTHSRTHLDVSLNVDDLGTMSERGSTMGSRMMKSGSRRGLLSKDTTFERHNMSTNALTTYKNLDTRYDFLIPQLDILDLGLNSASAIEVKTDDDRGKDVKEKVSKKNKPQASLPVSQVSLVSVEHDVDSTKLTDQETVDVIPLITIRISPGTTRSNSVEGSHPSMNSISRENSVGSDSFEGGTMSGDNSDLIVDADNKIPIDIEASTDVESDLIADAGTRDTSGVGESDLIAHTREASVVGDTDLIADAGTRDASADVESELIADVGTREASAVGETDLIANAVTDRPADRNESDIVECLFLTETHPDDNVIANVNEGALDESLDDKVKSAGVPDDKDMSERPTDAEAVDRVMEELVTSPKASADQIDEIQQVENYNRPVDRSDDIETVAEKTGKLEGAEEDCIDGDNIEQPTDEKSTADKLDMGQDVDT